MSRFNLYHGTSSIFLDEIKRNGLGGKKILNEWFAFDFVRELNEALDRVIPENENGVFKKIASQSVGNLNFQHGETYLSPSLGTAARYAASNRYGSELISEAFLALDLLEERAGSAAAEGLLSKFPAIKSIRGINCRRMLVTVLNADADLDAYLTEHGQEGRGMLSRLLQDFQSKNDLFEALHQQDNVRLKNPVPWQNLSIQEVVVTGNLSGFPTFEIKPWDE